MSRMKTRMLAVMAALSLGAGLMAGCGGGGDASSSGSAVTSSGTEAAGFFRTSSESASVSASSGEDSAADSAASSGSSGETAEASYPRELQVSEDTTVILESRPERVASLVFGTDEMLLGLTDAEFIAGLSGLDNGCAYLAADASVYEDIPRINENAEILMDLEPDFIIGSSWVDEDLKAQIADSGIPFYGYTTPKTLEEQVQIVKDLGYLLGDDEKTEALVQDMEERIQAVETVADGIAEEDKVRVMAYNMHESSNALGTIFDDMVTTAGAVNESSEAGLEGTAKISKEQIVEMNPEVIILVEWASDTDEEFQAFVETLKSDESLQTVDAVKNGRIYASTDNSITNVSQFAVDGLEFIAESCYPDLYK